MKPQDFAGREPRLVLEDYFAGKTRAYGIFLDRFGTVRRQFVVDILGTWKDGLLTLEEDFVYADGETDRRVWRIRKIDEHRYEGSADDVLGVAAGEAHGNAFNWRYRMALKIGDQSLNVTFNDWFFLQEDGVLINRAEVSKFGVDIGAAIIVFQPSPAAVSAGEREDQSAGYKNGRAHLQAEARYFAEREPKATLSEASGAAVASPGPPR